MTNYSHKIQAVVNTPGFSIVNSLGIIRDADTNFASTFQSVQSALINSSLPVPNQPLIPIISQRSVNRVDVFIMPNNQDPGCLEDLLLQSVLQNQEIICVSDFFTCLDSYQITPRQISKAKVQTFLSAQRECGISLGVAAMRGYWPFNNQSFSNLQLFLQNL